MSSSLFPTNSEAWSWALEDPQRQRAEPEPAQSTERALGPESWPVDLPSRIVTDLPSPVGNLQAQQFYTPPYSPTIS